MPLVAKSDLSTGNQSHASYLLRFGDLSFLFTAPYSETLADPTRPASIPTSDHSASRAFSAKHGLGVRTVAIKIFDSDVAYNASVSHGVKSSSQPIVLNNRVTIAEVQLYGDVVLRYVSYKDPAQLYDPNPDLWFLPRFEPVPSSFPLDFSLCRLDHAVGNVSDLDAAMSYVKGFTGFHEFVEFTAEDIGTSESGLNSAVLENNDETVLLPMNEPVYGTKRKSQIQTYLKHNEGAGVQHLALVSEDIFRMLREMRQRSGIGGFDFMPSPPPTYYWNLKKRAGDVLTDEQIKECEKLGILVDRDDQGTLLQIFTKPVGDRPTIFIEIIQRVGCMMKNEKGEHYQKGGCGGFGKGNFSELFKSIEEYEKTLEVRQIAEPVSKDEVHLETPQTDQVPSSSVRPMGVKVAKEAKRKGKKSMTSTNEVRDAAMKSIAGNQKKWLEGTQKREETELALLKEQVANKREELQMRALSEETKIMCMDTDLMTPKSKRYFSRRKNEILKKQDEEHEDEDEEEEEKEGGSGPFPGCYRPLFQ